MKLNEKEFTNLKRLSDTVYDGCQCKNCPYNLSDTCIKNYDANYCEIVLGKRLALYEDIGRDIVDTNSDGYDDSSYTAGYNSGSENYKGLILSLSGMTLSWNSYVGGEFDHYMLVITCDTDNYTQPNFIEVDKSLTSYTLSKSDIEDFYQGEVNKLIVSVQAQNASDNTVGDVSNSVTVYYNSTEYSLGYNEGLSEGFLRGQNSAGAGDLTDLVPKILGAVSGFFVSTTGSMTVGGISVLSIISVICLAVLAYLIFKVVNK